MGVGVQGEAGGEVAEHSAHGLDVHPVLQSQGGEGVPKLVEAANKAILVGAENEICYNADRLRFAVACFCMEGRIIHGTKEP